MTSDINQISVKNNCTEDWDKMRGDGNSRHCSVCRKNVYHLSAMTEDEILSFMETQKETPCIRYFEREDGTMMTSDCSVKTEKHVKLMRIAAIFTTILSPIFLFIGCTKNQLSAETPPVSEDVQAPENRPICRLIVPVTPEPAKVPAKNPQRLIETKGDMIIQPVKMGKMKAPEHKEIK